MLQRLWNVIVEYGLIIGFSFVGTAMIGALNEITYPYFLMTIAAIGGTIVDIILIRRENLNEIIILYQDRHIFQLWEAACLWVEVDPTYPLTNRKAIAKLNHLKKQLCHIS